MLLSFLLACGAGVPSDTAAPADPAATEDSADPEDTAPSSYCATASADDPCCRPDAPELFLSVCAWGLPVDTPVSGAVHGWGGDEPTLVADDGERWPLQVQGGAAIAALPDLGAAGRVTFVQTAPVCELMEGVLQTTRIEAADGKLLYLGGLHPLEADDWTVWAEPDVTTCPIREDVVCYDGVHNRPVTVEHAEQTGTLWPGDVVEIAGYVVRIALSSSAAGERRCDDGPERENTFWSVVPAP